MSLFGKKTDAVRLLARLDALEDSVSDLQRAKRSLELEFTELYDKVRHQMSRMAKRDAAARTNGEEPPVESEVPGPLDHLDPISRSIMLRRGMVGGRK